MDANNNVIPIVEDDQGEGVKDHGILPGPHVPRDQVQRRATRPSLPCDDVQPAPRIAGLYVGVLLEPAAQVQDPVAGAR